MKLLQPNHRFLIEIKACKTGIQNLTSKFYMQITRIRVHQFNLAVTNKHRHNRLGCVFTPFSIHQHNFQLKKRKFPCNHDPIVIHTSNIGPRTNIVTKNTSVLRMISNACISDTGVPVTIICGHLGRLRSINSVFMKYHLHKSQIPNNFTRHHTGINRHDIIPALTAHAVTLKRPIEHLIRFLQIKHLPRVKRPLRKPKT